MDVSKNMDTPKWMVYNGNPYYGMIWGYPYFRKHPYNFEISTSNFQIHSSFKQALVCLKPWWLENVSQHFPQMVMFHGDVYTIPC